MLMVGWMGKGGGRGVVALTVHGVCKASLSRMIGHGLVMVTLFMCPAAFWLRRRDRANSAPGGACRPQVRYALRGVEPTLSAVRSLAQNTIDVHLRCRAVCVCFSSRLRLHLSLRLLAIVRIHCVCLCVGALRLRGCLRRFIAIGLVVAAFA